MQTPIADYRASEKEIKMAFSCRGNSCHDADCVDCHPLEHCCNHEHYHHGDYDSCSDKQRCERYATHKEIEETREAHRCPTCGHIPEEYDW